MGGSTVVCTGDQNGCLSLGLYHKVLVSITNTFKVLIAVSD